MMEDQMQQAQAAAQQFMQQHGLDPRTMAAVGEMAQAAIQDKALYAMLREQLISAEILTEKELPEETNYITLATLATLGKLAEGV